MLDLSGTMVGLILVHAAYGIAFTTLFFRNFYVTIPDEIVSAARIDGAGFWSIFLLIILPVSGPIAIVAVIWQLGTGQAQSYYHLAHLARATGARVEDKARFGLTRTVQSVAAQQAFGRAGVTPADIDVAELYDSFTITVLLQLEDLGFCAKGEGGAFAENGRIELGGQLPVNTHGGLLSFGSSGGINHIIEAARQMRGEGGARQVADAKVALATNVSAVASNHSIAILGRD